MAVSFMHLELRRKRKDDGSAAGVGDGASDCSPRGRRGGRSTSDLFVEMREAKRSLLLKKLCAWVSLSTKTHSIRTL